MPIVGEQLVQFRTFTGIDLNTDSRVTNPTAWNRLQNIYGKTPGRLSKRPGSTVFVDTYFLDNYGSQSWYDNSVSPPLEVDPIPLNPDPDTWDDDHEGDPKGTEVTSELTKILGLHASSITGSNKDILFGVIGTQMSASEIAKYKLELGDTVENLGIGPNAGTQRFFYISPDDGKAYIMEQAAYTMFGSGANPWQFISALRSRSRLEGDNYVLKDIIGGNIARWGSIPERNQLNVRVVYQKIQEDLQKTVGGSDEGGEEENPLGSSAIIAYGTCKSGWLVVIFNAAKASLSNGVLLQEDTIGVANCDPNSDATRTPFITDTNTELKVIPFVGAARQSPTGIPDLFQVSGVQSLGQYSGCLVLGGYQVGWYGATGNDAYVAQGNQPVDLQRPLLRDNRPHYVWFSDVDRPHTFGFDSFIQIGAGTYEPVTGMGNILTETDSAGLRTQLAIFTDRKCVVYDGIPPQSTDTDETPTDFRQTMNFGMGCVATRSIVETPKGLIFLGTDGIIYMMRGQVREGLVPIGRAIEPVLKTFTPYQQQVACAVYDDGFYKLSIAGLQVDWGMFNFNKNFTGNGGTAGPVTQFWCDLRDLDVGAYDAGARWSGPHTGQRIGFFAKARGHTDSRDIYGGIYDKPTIAKVDENTHGKDYTGEDIEIIAESPEMDLGDAHIDKIYSGAELGVETNIAANYKVDIVATASAECTTSAASYTQAISPCSLVWGGFTYSGAPPVQYWGSSSGFSLFSAKNPTRLRGRVFQAQISDTSNALVSFSDLTVKFIPSRRRN